MDLREAIARAGFSLTDFAKKCKISPTSLWKYLNGKNARLEIACRIETLTGGRIKASSLVKANDKNRIARKTDLTEKT